jgi:hypothetical protein
VARFEKRPAIQLLTACGKIRQEWFCAPENAHASRPKLRDIPRGFCLDIFILNVPTPGNFVQFCSVKNFVEVNFLATSSISTSTHLLPRWTSRVRVSSPAPFPDLKATD